VAACRRGAVEAQMGLLIRANNGVNELNWGQCAPLSAAFSRIDRTNTTNFKMQGYQLLTAL
jgi:hypothetical protein